MNGRLSKLQATDRESTISKFVHTQQKVGQKQTYRSDPTEVDGMILMPYVVPKVTQFYTDMPPEEMFQHI